MFIEFQYFLAPQETESVKRQYTKLLDAYGCLGVLQLNAGMIHTKIPNIAF